MRGLLTLSSNPVTYGHLDIIKRAAAKCDELVVAVTDNPGKDNLFDAGTRKTHVMRALKETYPDLTNVRAITSPDVLTDIFMAEDCDVVFRGVRDEHDLEYEDVQAQYHRNAYPPMGPVYVQGDPLLGPYLTRFRFLEADPKLKHVQSSAVREFAVRHMDVTPMTPMFVQARLWRVLHQQKVIGIMDADLDHAASVSAALDSLRTSFDAVGITTHLVDMTKYKARLEAEACPGYVNLIKRGPSAEILWHHYDRLLRHDLTNKAGVVLVRMEDPSFLPRVNNNVVLVHGEDRGPLEYLKTEAAKHQEKHHYGTTFEFEVGGNVPYTLMATEVVKAVRNGTI